MKYSLVDDIICQKVDSQDFQISKNTPSWRHHYFDSKMSKIDCCQLNESNHCLTFPYGIRLTSIWATRIMNHDPGTIRAYYLHKQCHIFCNSRGFAWVLYILRNESIQYNISCIAVFSSKLQLWITLPSWNSCFRAFWACSPSHVRSYLLTLLLTYTKFQKLPKSIVWTFGVKIR